MLTAALGDFRVDLIQRQKSHPFVYRSLPNLRESATEVRRSLGSCASTFWRTISLT